MSDNAYGELGLLPQHEAMLRASAISPEVAKARGYRSITSRAELERLGFAPSQRRVPALLIPIRSVHGEIATYQIRPDGPRINRQGKPVKYETPGASRLVLDIHPAVRGPLSDPKVPLYVTEGAKKVDAAVSIGLCCIGILGVYGWRGTAETGGRTALADWELVALNGREVLLAFDSDVVTKRQVHEALARLKAFLESRGARVSVIYLPSGDRGEKTGLDDFLASGRTAENLLALASGALRAPPDDDAEHPDAILEESGPYRERESGIYVVRYVRDEPVEQRLTHFRARIVCEIVRDDGQETQGAFELECHVAGRAVRCTLPAAKFLAMGWPTEHLGARAIVASGLGARDQAREAIQLLSREVAQRRVFTHTGWVRLGDEWAYLHAGGAIGTVGTVEGVDMDLPRELARHRLPAPPQGDDRIGSIGASLRLLDVAPDRITVPLFCGIYRAPLGACDFSVHVAGATGVGKSELAALCAQHYGPEMDRHHLKSWASTANALETLAFHAKDALLAVDDFAPGGTQQDVARLHREADRILRAQGNQSGRARLSGDGSLRMTRSPRGMILSSGEDVPRGASIRARTCVLEVGPGDVRWDLLTPCQADARDGRFAASLAGYLQFVAGRRDEISSTFRNRAVELRGKAHRSDHHRRTASMVGDLMAAAEVFVSYAVEARAIGPDDAGQLLARAWTALGEAVELHERHVGQADPVAKLLDLLPSAIASGEAHLADPEGRPPDPCAGYGWQYREGDVGGRVKTEWIPQGRRVGWVDGEDLFLDLNAAVKAVQSVAGSAGDGLSVSTRTLLKRLDERGLLLSREADRGRLTVRRTLEGVRREVAHLSLATLCPPGEPSQLSHSAHPPPGPPPAGGTGHDTVRDAIDGSARAGPSGGGEPAGSNGADGWAIPFRAARGRDGTAPGVAGDRYRALPPRGLGLEYAGGPEPEELRARKSLPAPTPLFDPRATDAAEAAEERRAIQEADGIVPPESVEPTP